MSTIVTVTTTAMDVLQALPAANPPNPQPAAPEGAGDSASTLMGIIKWGALFVIIAVGFLGGAALAAGHVTNHQRSSQVGVRMLGGAVGAAFVYAFIYTFLIGIAT